MPELHVGERHWSVSTGKHVGCLEPGGRGRALQLPRRQLPCLPGALSGAVEDKQPDALNPAQRQEGWRLACQCQVLEDVQVDTFDPLCDGLPA